MSKKHVSLASYLESEIAQGKLEFRVVAKLTDVEGQVKIYIHPLGKDGESRDFSIVENTTQDVTRWLPDAN
jgi:hypothetical protein